MTVNPAQANDPVTETCSPAGDRRTDLTLTVGETLTINVGALCTRIQMGAPFEGKASVTVGGVTTDYQGVDRTQLMLPNTETALVVYTATEVTPSGSPDLLQVNTTEPEALAYAGQIWRITVLAAPDPDPTPEPDPLVRNLAFALPADMMCGNANRVESTELWVQLPGPSECSITGSAERSQAPQLLGWATTADFPVALAQRQINNGWGAYELFDDSGNLAAVFIPAGGFAALTADAQLFPIMSG